MLLFASEKYEITVVEQVAQLKIAKVTPSDVGVYTCEAKNEAGVATSRTNIILGKFHPINIKVSDVYYKSLEMLLTAAFENN